MKQVFASDSWRKHCIVLWMQLEIITDKGKSFLSGCRESEGYRTWSCHKPSSRHLQHAPDGTTEVSDMGLGVWGAPYSVAQPSLFTTMQHHLTAAGLPLFVYMDARLSWTTLHTKTGVSYCCLHQKLKKNRSHDGKNSMPWWGAGPQHPVCAMGTRGLYLLGREDGVRKCFSIAESIWNIWSQVIEWWLVVQTGHSMWTWPA